MNLPVERYVLDNDLHVVLLPIHVNSVAGRIRFRSGHAYSVSGGLEARREGGLIQLRTVVAPTNLGATLDTIIDEMKRLRSAPPTGPSLTIHSGHITLDLHRWFVSQPAIARMGAQLLLDDLPLDFPRQRIHRLADLPAPRWRMPSPAISFPTTWRLSWWGTRR